MVDNMLQGENSLCRRSHIWLTYIDQDLYPYGDDEFHEAKLTSEGIK